MVVTDWHAQGWYEILWYLQILDLPVSSSALAWVTGKYVSQCLSRCRLVPSQCVFRVTWNQSDVFPPYIMAVSPSFSFLIRKLLLRFFTQYSHKVHSWNRITDLVNYDPDVSSPCPGKFTPRSDQLSSVTIIRNFPLHNSCFTASDLF